MGPLISIYKIPFNETYYEKNTLVAALYCLLTHIPARLVCSDNASFRVHFHTDIEFNVPVYFDDHPYRININPDFCVSLKFENKSEFILCIGVSMS